MWNELKFLFIVALSFVVGESIRYDDFRVYKVIAETTEDFKAIQKSSKVFDIKFWKEPRLVGESFDVMVPPDHVTDFEDFLQNIHVEHNLTISNVQSLIASETPSRSRSVAFDWTSYHTLDEINAWVEWTAQRFSNQVSLFSIGKSYEGREIKGLRISYKEGNKAVFIEANIHAREWISSAVITYIIDELLVSRHPGVRDIAENTDWYIIPVLNPDGFVYSHEVDRMWRKSRQPHDPDCIGTDMNRNFDFHWMSAGASDDPCTETYAGPYAQSEPEIAQLVSYINTLPDDYIGIYISMHSYSQLVLSPWGHTEELPENYDTMMYVAKAFADCLSRRYETDFKYGSSATTLYKVSGGSKEWAHGARGIPISYTIELRDKGQLGFILPPEQIIPSAKETLEGFIGMIYAARDKNIV